LFNRQLRSDSAGAVTGNIFGKNEFPENTITIFCFIPQSFSNTLSYQMTSVAVAIRNGVTGVDYYPVYFVKQGPFIGNLQHSISDFSHCTLGKVSHFYHQVI
jgi:hypothetical protein